jgi:hypothetical protein
MVVAMVTTDRRECRWCWMVLTGCVVVEELDLSWRKSCMVPNSERTELIDVSVGGAGWFSPDVLSSRS